MKKLKISSIIALVILNFISVEAQKVDSLYEVATWEDFRIAAITYTFDDNLPNQYSVAIPMLDTIGFKATFFTVTSWANNWNILKRMAKNGHEIASHTVTHTKLSTINDSLQNIEFKNSRDSINAHIDTIKCVTMATPNCVSGNRTLESKYYIAVRACQGVIEPKTPSDFLNVSSVVCGNVGSVNSILTFKNQINNTVTAKGWHVFLIHALDKDNGYSPLSSSIFKASLYYCKIRNFKCWVSTFGNVSRYIKERNDASVKQLTVKDSSITLQVTDTLDNALYNYPLTIRRLLPRGWKSAEVTQNDKTVSTMFVKADTTTYIIFKAVPNGGIIKLSRTDKKVTLVDQSFEYPDTIDSHIASAIPNIENKGSNKEFKLWNNSRTLYFSVPSLEENFNVFLYNILGVQLASYKVSNNNGVGNAVLPDNARPGLCIAKITDGKIFWSQKFILY